MAWDDFLGEESFERMKHMYFKIYRLKSIIIIYYHFFQMIPTLIISSFLLEKRNIIFKTYDDPRLVVLLKEGISDRILGMFVLC
jgi:hypothetical protein